MFDSDLEPDVQETAYRVSRLMHTLPIDASRKTQLRQELLRRHQELSAGNTQRAAFKLWPRLPGLKRLTVVAPPALAGAVVLSVVLWGLQISGHQQPQTAEAARITQALARTAPTLTRWHWTLTVSAAHRTPAVLRWQFALSPTQRLDVQSGRLLLFTDGQWRRISADPVDNPSLSDWNVAFAALAVQLSHVHYSLLATRIIQGHRTEGIRFATAPNPSTRVLTTLWVDPTSGLVLHIDRVKTLRNRVVEHDAVDYEYGRAP